MSWQDAILTIGQFIFFLALFPSILSKDKPALTTSILNAVVLFIMAFVDLTISLYGTAIGLFAVGAAWGILAFQKYWINKKSLRSKDLKKQES